MDFECAVERKGKNILPKQERTKRKLRLRRVSPFVEWTRQPDFVWLDVLLAARLLAVISICSQLLFRG